MTFAGCGTSPAVKTSSKVVINPLDQLQKDIDSILKDSLFLSSHVSIKVLSIDHGDVLYEHESKALMHPASNIKLFTAGAALSLLDTNYQFKTSVYIDDNILEGNLNGNIYLKGYGDPSLTTADLDSIALFIWQLGIRSISKDLVVDNSYFDDIYWGAGWTWDDDSDPDAPYISALSVNKNCIKISAISDSSTLAILMDPSTDFVKILNNARIVYDSVMMPMKMKLVLLNDKNTVSIEGEIRRNNQIVHNISLRSPEIFTGTLFKEALQRLGIYISGTVVNGLLPMDAREICQHSQTIEKTILNMNKLSDNLSAENALKVLGALKNGVPGTARNGISAVKQFLSSLNLDTTKFSMVDGSGVSRYNLLNSEQIVQYLSELYKRPQIFPMFYNSLPIAGVDGTLANRMNTYPAMNNLRAKTGTLNGVSCLSGYVHTRDGELLAFSIMMQNFISSTAYYRKIQDKIGNTLAAFSRNIR